MGGKTSLEPERIGPTEQSTILQKRTSVAMVHQLRSTTAQHRPDIFNAHIRQNLCAEAPAHHRGLGPRCQYFTFNSRQDTRKDPSAPLNKLVTHPTALT